MGCCYFAFFAAIRCTCRVIRRARRRRRLAAVGILRYIGVGPSRNRGFDREGTYLRLGCHRPKKKLISRSRSILQVRLSRAYTSLSLSLGSVEKATTRAKQNNFSGERKYKICRVPGRVSLGIFQLKYLRPARTLFFALSNSLRTLTLSVGKTRRAAAQHARLQFH